MDRLCCCLFLCFISLSFHTERVLGRHTKFTCAQGRAEGDKWFDGCRWCVCQSDGPLCSPAGCSYLVSQVAPCEKVGSRWRDGCYHCKCHVHGIECVANPACVILMQREEYQRQILLPGACVEPADDRCVCGVDGVPSCTAEVIDRNAFPATTVNLYPTRIPSTQFDFDRTPYDDDGEEEVVAYRDDSRNHRIRRRSVSHDFHRHLDYALRLLGYKGGLSRSRNTYKKPNRFYNRRGSYFTGSNSPRSDYYSERARARQQRYPELQQDLDVEANLFPSEEQDVNHHITRSGSMDDYSSELMSDQPIGESKSLLIISNNRCRYGQRWYGGSLRCYCDEDGSITCGDPQFVAERIDGYRQERTHCEEGHSWFEDDDCQYCECKVSGVVLCRRSESCPLPFLIKPVSELRKRQKLQNQRSLQNTNRANIRTERISANYLPMTSRKTFEREDNSYNPNIPVDVDVDDDRDGDIDNEENEYNDIETASGDRNIGLSTDMSTVSTSISPVKDLYKHKNTYFKKQTPKQHRQMHVIVTECNPGTRWLDGCKRCLCTHQGRKKCDDSRCLKAPSAPFIPRAISMQNTPHGTEKDRPFQRPPYVPIARNKPVKIKSPFPEKKPCGRYGVGEMYWVACNRCVCYPHGPKCTAISCV